jgi:NAD(P)-dependent dehydrogenase (short-subunit alcohol dehydrogenase family)
MTKNYLIIGSNSAIGQTIMRRILADGNQVFSVSRQPNMELSGKLNHVSFDVGSEAGFPYAFLPEDMAAMTHFLLSEQARWITGQVLHVDGGISTIRK